MKNKKSILILSALVGVLIICFAIVLFVGKSNKTTVDNTTNQVENSETSETDKTKENNEVKLNDALTTDEISMEDLIASVELGDYSKIEITAVKDEVTDEDIQKEIETFLSYYDSYEHITDGVVENGKTVNIDYVGKLNGEEFDGGSAKNYNLEIGSKTFIDGFEEGLVGKKIGETVSLNLTFPSDYKSKDLAGKEVVFDVTINYVLGDVVKAELTDEFLKTNTDYDTVEDLKKEVKEYLTLQNESSYEVARENEVLDYLIKNSEIPKIPVTYTDEYAASMKEYYESYAEYYGITFEDFLKSNLNLTKEEFEEECLVAAINYMQSTILLESIASKENITLSDEEFNTYVSDFATSNGYETAEDLLKVLEENEETEDMRKEALYGKVMKKLFENIVVLEAKVEANN